MSPRPFLLSVIVALLPVCVVPSIRAQTGAPSQQPETPPEQTSNSSAPKAPLPGKQPSPDEALQLAVNTSGADRAALVHNLEDFLRQYPDYPKRTGIYRALVEASIQLQDNARAADYAERMVSLNPDDPPTAILAIQLLEQQGDEAGLRRAVNYSSRVLELVEQRTPSEKSPRVSQGDWVQQKRRDRVSVLSLRGRLEEKLKDLSAAEKDFQASYALLPTATAAEHLGEIAELNKDLNTAIRQYARAFALSDSVNGSIGRRDIRKKLGNVWRLAHGTEDELGEYLLQIFDDVSHSAGEVRVTHNEGAREIPEFTLRKAPDGSPYPLKDAKGKVIVINFWATWCGPCHALEPLFARVAAEFHGLPTALFLSADCDEDETLVGPYLQADKPRTEVVFADGLERLFSVDSFPTVIVIGRDGKIAFRTNGFEPDTFERNLSAAVTRALASPPAAQP